MSIKKRGKLFTSFVRTEEEKKLIKIESELKDTKRELELLKEMILENNSGTEKTNKK